MSTRGQKEVKKRTSKGQEQDKGRTTGGQEGDNRRTRGGIGEGKERTKRIQQKDKDWRRAGGRAKLEEGQEEDDRSPRRGQHEDNTGTQHSSAACDCGQLLSPKREP